MELPTTKFVPVNQDKPLPVLPISTSTPKLSHGFTDKLQDKTPYSGTTTDTTADTTTADGTSTHGCSSSLKSIPPLFIFLTIAYSIAFSFYTSLVTVIVYHPTFPQVCPSSHDHAIKLSFVERFGFQVMLLVICLLGKELKFRAKVFAFFWILSCVVTIVLVGSTNFYYQRLSASKELQNFECETTLELASAWVSTAAMWVILVGNIFITSQILFYAIKYLTVCKTRFFFYWMIWEVFLYLLIHSFIRYIVPSMTVFTLSVIFICCCIIFLYVTMEIVIVTNRFTVPDELEKPQLNKDSCSEESSSSNNKLSALDAIAPSTSDGDKLWNNPTISASASRTIIIFTIYFSVYLMFYCWTSTNASLDLSDHSFISIVLNNTNSAVFYIVSVTELLTFLLVPFIELSALCSNPVKGLLAVYCVVTTVSFINTFVSVLPTITTYVGLWVFFYAVPLFMVHFTNHCCTISTGFHGGSKLCLYSSLTVSFTIGALLVFPLSPFLLSQPYAWPYTHWLTLAGTVGCVIAFKFYEPMTTITPSPKYQMIYP